MYVPPPGKASEKVIPFRGTVFRAPESAKAGDGAARLRHALAVLGEALEQQRNAVTGWREAIGTLRGTIHGRGDDLRAYGDRLNSSSRQTALLTLEAHRLRRLALAPEGTADG